MHINAPVPIKAISEHYVQGADDKNYGEGRRMGSFTLVQFSTLDVRARKFKFGSPAYAPNRVIIVRNAPYHTRSADYRGYQQMQARNYTYSEIIDLIAFRASEGAREGSETRPDPTKSFRCRKIVVGFETSGERGEKERRVKGSLGLREKFRWHRYSMDLSSTCLPNEDLRSDRDSRKRVEENTQDLFYSNCYEQIIFDFTSRLTRFASFIR
ncbi:hypothetical protein KPH14_012420 [Odynerus spinipes]|uniref:Uncharacterized protein n=1 Tax=Odynerus spinipes TaxID=1348599 RepID=A0AAD9RI39_9HYME|nr:hypothetical protein KPH14_012420 [Odynerus spinipes]